MIHTNTNTNPNIFTQRDRKQNEKNVEKYLKLVY